MYKYRYIIPFIYTFFVISLSLFGQSTTYLDSLLAEEKQSPKDTNYINLLGQISLEYTYSDTEKAMQTITKALQLSKQLKYKKGIAMAQDIKGIAHFDRGELDSALFYYLKSLEYFKKSNDSIHECKIYNKIVQVYTHSNNYEMAEKYSDLSLALALKINDYKLLGNTENAKVSVYMNKAWYSLEKDGDSLAFVENFEKATPHLLQAIEYFNKAGYEKGSALAYGNLAYLEISLENYRKGLEYALRAEGFFEKNNFKNYLALSYSQITALYLKLKNLEKALEYAQKNLAISLEMDNPTDEHNAYGHLSDVYEALGDYKNALVNKQLMYDASKEVYNNEKEKQIARIQGKYDVEKKEQENLLLKKQSELDRETIKKQNTITLTVAISLLLVSIVAFLSYRAFSLRKRASLKIQELNANQTRWFTNIAHELRTPLTLILGPLKNILSQSDQLLPSIAEEVALANKNGQQLLKLVNQILDISKMDTGQLHLNRQPTNLSLAVKNSVAFFSSFATYKNIKLSTSTKEDYFVLVDEEKINNILINLISNALKFTNSGGNVSVITNYNKNKKHITVQVVDSGDGISGDDLPKVFNRFYQVKNKGRVHQGGSGIGLALSLEFAKLHGGNITVTSIIGKGSKFILELPASLLCGKPHETEQEKIVGTDTVHQDTLTIRSNEKPNLLLVEDNPDMQQYIANNLKKDYHILKATDGLDALEKLKNFTPDLIISDVMMPRMDGLELANRLKENSRYKLIPFITLTARADEQAKLDALRIGIDDYIVKPFNLDELQTRVHNLIINHKERKKAIEENVATGDDEISFSHEEKIINQLKEEVNKHINDSSFSVKELAEYAAMSESTLHRTTKKTTGLTPGHFIREIKLQKALQLLENRKHQTISEVVYAVGFENQTHFSKLFKNRYGKSPAEYLTRIIHGDLQ